jgi:hypothetical protein
MERPLIVSGLSLGIMVLGGMFFLLIISVRLFSWRKRVGNLKQDKNFHLRYNAFKRNLNAGSGRDRRKTDQYEGVSGYEKLPDEKSANLVDLSSGLGDNDDMDR